MKGTNKNIGCKLAFKLVIVILTMILLAIATAADIIIQEGVGLIISENIITNTLNRAGIEATNLSNELNVSENGPQISVRNESGTREFVFNNNPDKHSRTNDFVVTLGVEPEDTDESKNPSLIEIFLLRYFGVYLVQLE